MSEVRYNYPYHTLTSTVLYKRVLVVI
jgi:hypothetical protein